MLMGNLNLPLTSRSSRTFSSSALFLLFTLSLILSCSLFPLSYYLLLLSYYLLLLSYYLLLLSYYPLLLSLLSTSIVLLSTSIVLLSTSIVLFSVLLLSCSRYFYCFVLGTSIVLFSVLLLFCSRYFYCFVLGTSIVLFSVLSYFPPPLILFEIYNNFENSNAMICYVVVMLFSLRVYNFYLAPRYKIEAGELLNLRNILSD